MQAFLLGLFACVAGAVRIANDDWLKPVEAVNRFLSRANKTRCDFPTVDASKLTWEDFKAQGSKGPALLKGLLLDDWFKVEEFTRNKLLSRFGEDTVWHIDGRHDHTFTSSSTSAAVMSLRNFTEILAVQNISRVATGYDLALESKVFRQVWNTETPAVLRNFDLKPIVSIAMSRGSGVQFHHHAETWLGLLHGAKAWWVAAESDSPEVLAESQEHTSHPCSWLEKPPPAGLTFCVQMAGDVVYFGDKQLHATCNLHDYVLGIGSQGRIPTGWSDMDMALHRGDVDLVQQLSSTGKAEDILSIRSPQAPYAGGTSPLHRAAKKGQESLVQHLLSKKADAALTTSAGTEPLHEAVFNSHLPVINMLIKRGGNVNAQASDGARPLHVAARPGHPAVIAALIHAGADVHAADNAGDQALHIAASQGHLHLCGLLLSMHAKVDVSGAGGMHPIHNAAAAGHAATLAMLVSAKADLTAREAAHGMLPIGYAAAAGHKSVLELILKHGKIPSSDGVYPLHGAAQGGHVHALDALLRAGADANARFGQGASALHLAARRGRKEACEALLKWGVDAESVDDSYRQPVHWAAAAGHLDVVKLHLAHGVEVRAVDALKNQALHFASGGGHDAVVSFLLAKKARVDVRNADQQRPLDMAIAGGKIAGMTLKGGHSSVVEILLRKGAKVQSSDPDMAEDAGHMAISAILAQVLKSDL